MTLSVAAQGQVVDKWALWQNMGFTPHEKQEQIARSRARFRVACCGRRFGKSKLNAAEAAPYIMTPGARVWIVGPTYELAYKVGREIDAMLAKPLGYPGHFKRRETELLKWVTPWGSEVVIKSAEDPDKSLVGDEVDYLGVTEAAKMGGDVWEKHLRATLSTRKGAAFIESTPEGMNWFKKKYDLGQNPGERLWESWQIPSVGLPDYILDPEEVAAAMRELTPRAFKAEYLAQFTAYAGSVYSDLCREGNLVFDGLGYDPRMPLFCGLDFGFRRPAAIWAQAYNGEDGRMRMRVIDALCRLENLETSEFAHQVKGRGWHDRTTAYYGDPAGDNANPQGEKGQSEIGTFARFGMRVRCTKNRTIRDLNNSLNAVRALILAADGKRRIEFCGVQAMQAFEDVEAYRYPKRRAESSFQEKPFKDGVHDHICDALRYLIINLAPELAFRGQSSTELEKAKAAKRAREMIESVGAGASIDGGLRMLDDLS